MDFIDLKAQQRRIRKELDAAIGRVLDHGAYVMGPEVRAFEAALAHFGQAKLALSCANGTDAVVLPLMAWGVGPGDAVFCPSFTFAATAEVVPWTGATPVFVDILPDTYNLDPDHFEAAIDAVKAKGELRPAAVIAVTRAFKDVASAASRAGMARGGFDAGAAPKRQTRPRRRLAYCGRKMVLTMGSTLVIDYRGSLIAASWNPLME